MKAFISLQMPFYLLILCSLSCAVSCSGNPVSSQGIAFVGSTPGDDYIKSLFAIKKETIIDFIRWNLTLDSSQPSEKKFTLRVNYGESQPNTLGFKSGGENYEADGKYYVSSNNANGRLHGEMYHLKSPHLQGEIRMIKLNDNLFQLLNTQNELLIGNGGWSYTLNREKPVDDGTIPSFSNKEASYVNTQGQVIYVGRTPCQDIANEHEMNASSSCFKLKWKLILNRDPVSFRPTTYSTRKIVDNESKEISGKWTETRNANNQPGVVIYHLDPDKPGKTISLLASDENVIFFLNKKLQLYTGNNNFSYTLNKSK